MYIRGKAFKTNNQIAIVLERNGKPATGEGIIARRRYRATAFLQHEEGDQQLYFIRFTPAESTIGNAQRRVRNLIERFRVRMRQTTVKQQEEIRCEQERKRSRNRPRCRYSTLLFSTPKESRR